MQPSLKSQFLLNPDVTYLNFGAYGACPNPIFDDYQKWQRELEYEPTQFIVNNGPRYIKESREALARYIHCHIDDVVYVPNPTYGVNIVAKSLQLNPGDEILTTDIEYGACDRTWNYYCKKKNARYVRQHITLPVISKEQIIEDFFKGVTGRTKAIFISQITSTTALILPVKEICAIAKQKGLLTIVDGAHVPGHLPLDLTQIEADIYAGACHKWMMTPKGSSFLFAKKEFQHLLDPLSISWGYESANPSHSQFIDYHQHQGTRDISAYLTIPRSIQFMEEHNWPVVAANCRKLVQDNAQRFCNLLDATALCPVNDEFLGQMFSIPVKTSKPVELQRYLSDTYNITIPVMRQEKDVYMRYSINGFNSQQCLDNLYSALEEVLAKTDFFVKR